MNSPQKSQGLATVKNQVAAFYPTRQMLGWNALIERLARLMTGDFRDFGSDKPPSIARRIEGYPLKHDDIAQKVFEVTRGHFGPCGHRPRTSLSLPEREKLLVDGIIECKRGITKVIPLLLDSLLVKGADNRKHIHGPTLAEKA